MRDRRSTLTRRDALTCGEARQLKENRENLSYLVGAAAGAAGLFGAGVGAAIVGLVALGINYSATLVSRAMEDAGMLNRIRNSSWKDRIAYLILIGVIVYLIVYAVFFDSRWGLLTQ